jgi:transposase
LIRFGGHLPKADTMPTPMAKIPPSRRPRRRFDDEFKAQAARLVLDEGKSVGVVARDLDLTETALREWVNRARADRTRRERGFPQAPHSYIFSKEEESRTTETMYSTRPPNRIQRTSSRSQLAFVEIAGIELPENERRSQSTDFKVLAWRCGSLGMRRNR